MIISIIAAMANNNVIGCNNKIPWYLPEDLQYFKSVTINKPIIMGRKTFASLPKILPSRKHIVISRNLENKPNNSEVDWVNSLEAAIATAENYVTENNNEVMIIGGGQIYNQAMKFATKLYITKIAASYDGDVVFPEIDLQQWRLVKEQNMLSEKAKLKFSIQLYEK